ncbi:phosphodiester glycosidase family protein [Blastococcus sp. URHD0036]|uniref:phosphodiester glycosidase family protein n=1 Tax=Blastococcus sp. URHD0036 TaxID=1380356 RepID=UPI00068B430D|nr:phosphodiester glycosidase family protein [Blastococcus sp. URHD0036]
MTMLDQRPADVPAGSDGPATGRRARRWRRLLGLALAALLLLPAISFERAMTAPGGGSWEERTVEWVRDHGGAPVVNWMENWYYSRHEPSGVAPEDAALPDTALAPTQPAGVAGPPAVAPLAGAEPVAGEGDWSPGRTDSGGRPAIYTTFLRPDGSHPSVVVGAAWMRSGDTAAHLVAGSMQPGGPGWPGSAQVPSSDVPALVATFNSGWKFQDITGGFYLDGRTGEPLVDGQASVVIDDHGRVTVGDWGRDVTMTGHVAAVRQNLALVVDGGQPVDGLSTNAHGLWGSSRNQLQYTWRSGLGVDAHGNLVYVAGDGLTLQTLAAAMVDAGIQRGMELDIHPGKESFASWAPNGSSATPTALLPHMGRPADRYLTVDQRDFFYVTLR